MMLYLLFCGETTSNGAFAYGPLSEQGERFRSGGFTLVLPYITEA